MVDVITGKEDYHVVTFELFYAKRTTLIKSVIGYSLVRNRPRDDHNRKKRLRLVMYCGFSGLIIPEAGGCAESVLEIPPSLQPDRCP